MCSNKNNIDIENQINYYFYTRIEPFGGDTPHPENDKGETIFQGTKTKTKRMNECER